MEMLAVKIALAVILVWAIIRYWRRDRSQDLIKQQKFIDSITGTITFDSREADAKSDQKQEQRP